MLSAGESDSEAQHFQRRAEIAHRSHWVPMRMGHTIHVSSWNWEHNFEFSHLRSNHSETLYWRMQHISRLIIKALNACLSIKQDIHLYT